MSWKSETTEKLIRIELTLRDLVEASRRRERDLLDRLMARDFRELREFRSVEETLSPEEESLQQRIADELEKVGRIV